jgi:hypothetical protein
LKKYSIQSINKQGNGCNGAGVKSDRIASDWDVVIFKKSDRQIKKAPKDFLKYIK